MDQKTYSRTLMRAGFVLFLLALLTGLANPLFKNPRMGLSAHLEGVMNGLLLVVVGLIWNHLDLTARLASVTYWLFMYATYANWGATSLAAALGTSRLTPLAGAGYSASPLTESIVQVLQVSLAIAVIAGTVLVIARFRARSE